MKRYINLSKLYFNFYCNKLILIISLIALVIVFLILMFNSNINTDKYQMILYEEEMLKSYINESLFFLNIFNMVYICFLVSLENGNDTSKFDSLFISSFKRITIYNIKIFSYFRISIKFLLIEFLFLLGIPLLLYSNFNLEVNYLSIYITYLLESLEFIIIGFVLSISIPNVFSSLLTFLIYFFSLVIKNNDIVNEYLKYLIPKVVKEGFNANFETSALLFLIPIIFYYFLGFCLYNKKDLN